MRLRVVGAVLSMALFAATLIVLHHVLADVRFGEVLARLRETPARSVLLAVTFAAGSYLTLIGYDALALNYLGKPLSTARTALASFTSYAFSHNIGLSVLTGGSIRYRIYAAAGLTVTDVAQLTIMCGLTFGLGAGCLLGLALVLNPAAPSLVDGLPLAMNQALGVAILLTIVSYLTWAGLRTEPVRLWHWSLRPPSMGTVLAQLALGVVDLGFAAAALYVLFPSDVTMGFVGFVGIFVAATVLGVLSHTPGGLGVFEAAMLLMLPGGDQGAQLGALLAFRGIYYLVPLALAAALLAGHEFRLHRDALKPAVLRAQTIASASLPQVVGATVFISGAILLVSAATPALQVRMEELRHVLPLPFVEASHLLSSIVGLCLMVSAQGLFRRVDGAYWLTALLLLGGIAFSLLKGLDYEEAAVLVIALILLMGSRRSFYRRASLLNEPLSPAWLAAIGVVLAASMWLGIFAFKHGDYAHFLWWQFAYEGEASRSLRAGLALAVVAIGFAAHAALRPAPPSAADDPDWQAVKAIIARSPHTYANLALTRDKRFLLSANADAFIMYQIGGRTWVALGDPVGPESAWHDLLWSFRELCHRHGGRPALYQIAADSLPIYIDLGLSPFKLGEEALVDLDNFSLEASTHKELRYASRRASKEGAVFELVPRADVPALLPELRSVSDEWLKEKSTHEKGFSLGTFNEDYICNFDCAVVRHDDHVVAFANVWQAEDGRELSIDLMRHRSGHRYSVMDFLFAQLMLWGRANGYSRFNLGMAPLSGLETHPLGPVWARIGSFTFCHGEHFYNFAGLRAYKEKFKPKWVPKYLAVTGALALPRALLDIASLTSGGTLNIVRK